MAKRAADLYLTLMARKLWPEFVRRVARPCKKPPLACV